VLKLLKFLVSLGCLAAFVWWGVTVPLGERTLFQHVRAIGQSRESKELVRGAKDKVTDLTKRMGSEGDDDHGEDDDGDDDNGGRDEPKAAGARGGKQVAQERRAPPPAKAAASGKPAAPRPATASPQRAAVSRPRT
jgi:hypothetical protein